MQIWRFNEAGEKTVGEGGKKGEAKDKVAQEHKEVND